MMSYQEFTDTFGPLQNPFNEHAELFGCMFNENSAEEKAFIESQNPETIWTVTVCKEQDLEEEEQEGLVYNPDRVIMICSGQYSLGRIGFLVTKVKVPHEVDLFIEY